MSMRGIELGNFCSRERCLSRLATAPLASMMQIHFNEVNSSYYFGILSLKNMYVTDQDMTYIYLHTPKPF